MAYLEDNIMTSKINIFGHNNKNDYFSTCYSY